MYKYTLLTTTECCRWLFNFYEKHSTSIQSFVCLFVCLVWFLWVFVFVSMAFVCCVFIFLLAGIVPWICRGNLSIYLTPAPAVTFPFYYTEQTLYVACRTLFAAARQTLNEIIDILNFCWHCLCILFGFSINFFLVCSHCHFSGYDLHFVGDRGKCLPPILAFIIGFHHNFEVKHGKFFSLQLYIEVMHERAKSVLNIE